MEHMHTYTHIIFRVLILVTLIIIFTGSAS